MKVLITGGTGFIGCRLALRCLERGDEVTVVGQTNEPIEAANRDRLADRGADVREISVTDRTAIRSATAGQQVVIHLAAAQHEANVSDDYFWQINVAGTENVVDAAVEAGVARLIHGSTIGVYSGTYDRTLDEQSVLGPENIYEETKVAAENVVMEKGADAFPVVLRISETYGPGDYRLLKLFRAINKGMFFLIGSGDNPHHPVFVDDVIDCIFRCLDVDSAIGETFLLAGPAAVTTKEMTQTIASALETKLNRITMPLFPFIAAAKVMERTLSPLGIQPPIHTRRMDFFVKGYRFSTDKARERIGFQSSIDFAEGVRLTAEWYKQNGLI